MARVWISVLFLFACAGAVDAATIQAQGCSSSQVLAAINSASDGDTVVVPAGTCTWSSSLVISSKSITLQGAGAGATTIVDGITAPSSGGKPQAIRWTTKSTGLSRITGFTFDGGSSGGTDQSGHNGIVGIQGQSSQFRLDHVTFTNLNRTVGVQISGNVTGVVDHVIFNVGTHYGMYVFHDNWLGTGGYGDNSWAQPNTWGSSAFLFVEDCQFVAGSGGGINWGSDGWMGQRVVYRRNTYTNVLWANHGTETSGRQRSARASEVYQNKFILNNAGWNSQLCCLGSVIGTRGGTSLIWDNALSGTNGGGARQVVDMANLRSNDPRLFTFGVCNGFTAWDMNAGPELGYRCLDQPGAGKGDLMSGDNPTPFWPHQQLEPIYVWNNSNNGAQSDAVPNGVIPVAANRDYYNQVSGFNGAGGIGRGPIASRPTTCTPGVGYWATNEGEWDSTNGSTPDGRMYRCTSTNTWTLWYTPYTYPHPLVSGAVNTSSGPDLGTQPTNPVAPTPTTIVAAKSSYSTGETVVVNFTNSGSATDWIGLFVAGSADSEYLQWRYINGAQTATTSVANGSVSFSGGLSAAGNYEVRIFANDTMTRLAASTFSVQSTAAAPTIATSKSTYTQGDGIVATFANDSGNARDWIGIFAAGSANTAYLQWRYVNGSQTATTGVVNGSVTIPSTSLAAGKYEVRIFLSDSYTVEATAAFTIQGATTAATTITTSKPTFKRRDPIVVNFTNAASSHDWIGIYVTGAASTAYIDWRYTNGTKTQTTLLANGSVTFSSLPAGNYEVRIFSNDSYTVTASTVFSVGP